MLVQDYLRQHGLDKLVADYKIVATRHETEPLVILNYDMIESVKTEPIVQECRALTLDTRDWSVVARSFHRFFNYGEMVDLTSKFDWNKFEASSKEDGSLMVMYYYHGRWRVNTRGSFAKGKMCEGGPVWEDLFWKCVDKGLAEANLAKDCSYVFELCSPYNKIVRTYAEPVTYLLGIFRNHDGFDCTSPIVGVTASKLGVKSPQVLKFNNDKEIVDFLANVDLDATFEGFVLRDSNNLRMKIKNARYVALHHLRGNDGNLYLAKNLLPLILAKEDEEIVAYFPEAKERFRYFREIVETEETNLYKIWEEAHKIESQRDFAQFILPKTKLASILFDARKLGVHPKELWRDSSDRIINILPRSS